MTAKHRPTARWYSVCDSVHMASGRRCSCTSGATATASTGAAGAGPSGPPGLSCARSSPGVEAGVWEKPTRRDAVGSPAPSEVPLFDDYIEYWLTARFKGVLGERPLSANTRSDYRRQARHLKRFFGRYRLNEIDGALCLAFKTHKLREAEELREALQAGADLRDTRNRRVVPLGAASLKKLLIMLAAVLEDAVEDGHLSASPARSRRLRIHVPKPRRTFLEIDELACLEDIARARDPPLSLFRQAAMAARAGSTRAAVALAASEGKSQAAIVRDLGLAKGSVSYHLKHLDLGAIKYVGSWGDRLHPRLLGGAGQRVVRPEDRPVAVARPRAGALPDRRRED